MSRTMTQELKDPKQVKVMFFRPGVVTVVKGFENAVGYSIPLGILYLSSMLKRDGYMNISFFDNLLEGRDDEGIRTKLGDERPDILAITTTTPTLLMCKSMAAISKSVSKDCLVVLGGPHASSLPIETFKDTNVDALIVGEAEYTFLETVQKFSRGESLAGIKGLYSRDPLTGESLYPGPRPPPENLDDIPLPDRGMLDMTKYGPSFVRKNARVKGDNMMIGRGCSWGICTFCSRSVYGEGPMVRNRSVENIMEEIRELYYKYDVREILFNDETFPGDRKLVHALCKQIIKEKIKIGWSCQARVEQIDAPTARLFKKAGCNLIAFGIEHGHLKMRGMIKKGTPEKVILRTVRTCRRYGIRVTTGFILGLPGENKETIKHTIRLVKKIQPDFIGFNIFQPYAGSRLFTEAIEQGLIDPADYESYHNFGDDGLPKRSFCDLTTTELAQYQKRFLREYYFSPDYIFMKLKKVQSMQDVISGVKGLWALTKNQMAIGSALRALKSSPSAN